MATVAMATKVFNIFWAFSAAKKSQAQRKVRMSDMSISLDTYDIKLRRETKRGKWQPLVLLSGVTKLKSPKKKNIFFVSGIAYI